MLVFRCECEQVLGVEDGSTKGGMGECPTCGRVVRVPSGLVSAEGRLRLTGTPSRAMPSGKYSPISDSPRNGSNGSAVSGSYKPIVPEIAEPIAPSVPVALNAVEIAPVSVEPEIAVPLEIAVPVPTMEAAAEPELGVQISEPETDAVPPKAPPEIIIETESLEAAAAAPPVSATQPVPTTGKSASKNKPVSVRKPGKGMKSVPPRVDANDPNAAVETKNDRNLASVANAAASRRKKVESEAAPPAKKSFMLIYMIAMVALLIGAGVLYAMGFFSGAPAKTNTAPTGSSAVMKKETKPENTPEPKVAPNPDPKTDPAIPVKPPEPPADGEKKDEKKEDKKDPAADTKADDKKVEKKDPAADTKTDDKKDDKKDDKNDDKKDAAADTKADDKK